MYAVRYISTTVMIMFIYLFIIIMTLLLRLCLLVGGHYTTYALNYVNLSWYEYDDQIVTEVDPQQVENCEAYVLFYRFTTLMSGCLNRG